MTVRNREGLHARPATLLVEAANRFLSRVRLAREDGTEADARSIMALLTLAAPRGCRLTVRAEGPDAPQALEEVVRLFETGFGELAPGGGGQGG